MLGNILIRSIQRSWEGIKKQRWSDDGEIIVTQLLPELLLLKVESPSLLAEIKAILITYNHEI